MKKSSYNIFLEQNESKLAFNSLTCALAEIDDDFERLYHNIEECDYELLGEQDKKLYDDMKAGCYIIPDSTDELKLIKYRNNRGKFAKEFLSFVIAPTLACNFGCPYCYETQKPGFMKKEVQDKIIEIVTENAKKNRNIDITWYGGEPLLAKEIVYNMAERMQTICNEYNVPYSSGIITNGYLIKEEDIELFKKHAINYVQITVDGTREIHNSRRFLKSSPDTDTFEIIFNNIKKLYLAKVSVSIRVNIDKTNIDDTKSLIDFVKNQGMSGISIHFGHVSPYTDNNQHFKQKCLSMAEYSHESLLLQEYLHNNGFNASGFPYYPGIKGNYCGADSINTFVIDNEGYKYKCWNEVGNVKESVGNIMWDVDDYTDTMIDREIAYMTWSPFDNENCKKCELLPICMGGCPYTAIRVGKEKCERWKYSLTEVLKKTYLQKTEVMAD